MENLIYWKGVVVGIESGRMVQWFPSAPKEAMESLK